MTAPGLVAQNQNYASPTKPVTTTITVAVRVDARNGYLSVVGFHIRTHIETILYLTDRPPRLNLKCEEFAAILLMPQFGNSVVAMNVLNGVGRVKKKWYCHPQLMHY